MTAMSPGRLTIGALAAVILLCALAAGVHGTRAQAPAITIEGGSFEAAPDSAFAFEVTGESPHYTIGAFSISVTFDPDVLAPVSCQSHDARCDRGDGDGEVVMNNISLAGWTGDIHFGTVVFQAVGGARSQTPIDLTVTTISDTTGSELDRVTDETDGFASIDRDAPDHPLGDANCDLR